MSHKIIGTAGHIDHGKSSLVKALTGTDPDRLSEEQQRGMTIDLGFAFLDDNTAFIDVPGHEKFIKNMVAGVSTVDIAMLVIAADDGVMPQTREHLDILKILQLKHGLVALTKIDTVEEEWIDIVEEDVRQLLQNSFLQNAPILRVSSTTGAGVESLRQALLELAAQTETRQDRGVFWMPVDRSFTIKGHGTVVTGSVLSGSIRVGDMCDLLPDKRQVKIRGIQTHGAAAEIAQLGDRAALNLMSISKENIKRGDILATSNYFEPSDIMDGKLTLLQNAPRALTNRTRVRFHLGTREIMARLKLLGVEKLEPGHSAFVQFTLEESAVAQKRDPFVIRQYSPQLTIGGGFILDTNPQRHKRTDDSVLDRLQKLEKSDPADIVASLLLQTGRPTKSADLAKKTGLEQRALDPILKDLLEQQLLFSFGKGSYLHKNSFEKLKATILHTLANFHKKEPLRPGMKKANLLAQTAKSMPTVFEAAIKNLNDQKAIDVSNEIVKLASHEIKLSGQDEKLTNKIYDILQNGQFTTPPLKVLAQDTGHPQVDVLRCLNALLGLGKIVRFEGDIYFTKIALQLAFEKLKQFEKDEITVGEFREMLNTSRKFAMPLLGYFDDLGITERVGEIRVINKKETMNNVKRETSNLKRETSNVNRET